MSTAKKTAKGKSKPKSTKPATKPSKAAAASEQTYGTHKEGSRKAKCMSCSIRKVPKPPGSLGSN